MCKEVNLQQIVLQYGMSYKTFAKKIAPVRSRLLAISSNKNRLRIFTPKMLAILYEILGDPDDIKNKN